MLKTPFLTQGPEISRFEEEFARFCGAKYAVACSSATAGLHLSAMALGMGAGDLWWTSPNTFCATADAAVRCGADVDFIDIKWGTYNMDLDLLEDRLKQAARKNRLPKVVVPVHFAGNPVDMKILDRLRKTFGFKVVEDAAHATGAEYRGERVGSCRWSDLCVFSFHAVKIITTGEGGMVTTNSPKLYESLCRLRSHGISRDSKHLKNGNNYAWYYEKLELGNHYRMTDIQAALGRSQLKKIKNMHESRAIISSSYTRSLAGFPLDLPEMTLGARSSWHLYPVCVLQGESFRNKVMNRLRSMGVMANLHYLPAQKFQFHRQKKKYKYMPCSQAEKFSHREISLPIFPALNGRDIQKVVSCLSKALA